MLNLKYFVALAVITIVSCDVEIPEKYRNAKPLSEHPKYKELWQRLYPNILETEKDPFIIGGSPAAPGDIPHFALMFIIFPQDIVYICGGSIINPKWVLTVTFCIDRDANNFNIYTGIVNISGPATWGTAASHSDMHVHPQYNASALRNDIALVNLVNAPNDLLSKPYVGMIQLPTQPVNLVDFLGSISGFGQTSDNSSYASNVLKQNSLRVITNVRCSAYYVVGAIDDTHICAEANATASACGGDNGGPFSIVTNGVNRLEGIISFFAQSGCTRGYPVGFTRVSSYLRWINDTINGRNPNDELWDNLRDLQEQYLNTLQIIIEGASARKKEKLLKALKLKVLL
ncbi:hypothetical protein ACKWTF_010697 [Chironomus riparius]